MYNIKSFLLTVLNSKICITVRDGNDLNIMHQRNKCFGTCPPNSGNFLSPPFISKRFFLVMFEFFIIMTKNYCTCRVEHILCMIYIAVYMCGDRQSHLSAYCILIKRCLDIAWRKKLNKCI